jgi:hypothetical protein
MASWVAGAGGVVENFHFLSVSWASSQAFLHCAVVQVQFSYQKFRGEVSAASQAESIPKDSGVAGGIGLRQSSFSSQKLG